MNIDDKNFKMWIGFVKVIGYIAFIPFAILTMGLKTMNTVQSYIWFGLMAFLLLGSVFFYAIAPFTIDGWDSKRFRHAFRPYILCTMLVLGILIFYLIVTL